MKKARFEANDSVIEYVSERELEHALLPLLCDRNSKMERAVNGDITTLKFSKDNGKFVEFTITEEE